METMLDGLKKRNLPCTGCAACLNKCPVDAIKMVVNKIGFYRPVINDQTCISCGQCEQVCPVLYPIKKNSLSPACFAAQADSENRYASSSGGIFPLLAENIIKQGGYVFGAAWTSDFHVQQVGINKIEDLPKLRKSKYLQSLTGTTFREVKRILEEGIPVLYSGCPCHIAGLNKYLDKDYQHLILVDLVCTQAPPPELFRKYLDENYGLNNVKQYTFRDKLNGWKGDTVSIKLKNGEDLYFNANKDFFQKGYHPRLFIDESCMSCAASEFPRPGDLSIGDYWGIAKYDKNLDDLKGTSVILVNNQKGQIALDNIKPSLYLLKSTPIEWAKRHNRIGNREVPPHPARNRFFKLIKDHSFNEAVDMALNEKYDIGLVGVWNTSNHGSNLTYYALYQVLRELKLTVKMIDRAADAHARIEQVEPRLFHTSPYDRHDLLAPFPSKKEMKILNAQCKTFILGSDQLFNAGLYNLFGGHISMSWVRSNKRKISYAMSFGHDRFYGSDDMRAEISYYLQRFDFLSVREDSGVKVAKDYFDVDTTHVLDPVFLCPETYYLELINNGTDRLPESSYISSYVLDPNQELSQILNEIQNRLKMPVVTMSDANHQPEKVENLWKTKTMTNVTNEEWLANFYHSDFCVIDSFHGMCFAILFKKQFVVVLNRIRGVTRFTSLLSKLNLSDRAISTYDDLIKSGILDRQIDYNVVFELLNKEIEFSMDWLKNAVFSEIPKKSFSSYDVLDERCDRIVNDYIKRIELLENEVSDYHDALNECRSKIGLKPILKLDKHSEAKKSTKNKYKYYIKRLKELGLKATVKKLMIKVFKR